MTVLAGLLLVTCLVAGTAAAWILFVLFGPSMPRLNTLPRAVPTSSHAPVVPAPRLGSTSGQVAWTVSNSAESFDAQAFGAPSPYASDTSPFATAPALASDASSPFVAPSRPTPARAAAAPRPTPIAVRNQRLAEPFVAPPLKRPRPSPPPMPRARAARGTDSSTREQTSDFDKTNEVQLFSTDEHRF